MTIPNPMIPNKPGAQDHEAMNNRIKYLYHLYALDDRDNPDHPLRGTFTGLAIKYGHNQK